MRSEISSLQHLNSSYTLIRALLDVMKGFTHILVVSFVAFRSVSAIPAKGHKAANAAASTAAGISRGASTIVMKEVGGVPGNECLTFRNNGKSSVHFPLRGS